MQTVINGTAQSNQNYASAIQYAPQGATKQLTYGGSSGILETVTYNSRLQPTQIGATRGGTTVLSLGYDYGTANNNGNVMGITAVTDASRTQAFTYDALNPILVT